MFTFRLKDLCTFCPLSPDCVNLGHSRSALAGRALKFLGVAALLLISAPWAHAGLYDVASPAFSSSVSTDGNHEVIDPAIDGTISRSNLDQKLVYFSVTILGGPDAINYLLKSNQLQLNATIWADGEEQDTVAFGIFPERWSQIRAGITSAYQAQGYFTFRTYMVTQKINYSSIELVLKDPYHNVVAPVGFGGSYRAILKIVP